MEDLSAVSLSPSLSLCAPASVSEVSDDADPWSVSGIACAWIDVYENWTVISFALEIWSLSVIFGHVCHLSWMNGPHPLANPVVAGLNSGDGKPQGSLEAQKNQRGTSLTACGP